MNIWDGQLWAICSWLSFIFDSLKNRFSILQKGWEDDGPEKDYVQSLALLQTSQVV